MFDPLSKKNMKNATPILFLSSLGWVSLGKNLQKLIFEWNFKWFYVKKNNGLTKFLIKFDF